MSASVVRWVKGQGCCYFGRLSDGGVQVAVMNDPRAPDDPSGCSFLYQTTIDDGIWGSVVLTMTEFNERPNDWHAFMDHHHGRRDLLDSAKTLQTVRNVVNQ